MITNTPGILDRQGETLAKLNCAELEDLIANETVEGGMLPKAQCAMTAVRSGVQSAQIIDGTAPHALLLEIFTDAGIGTQITGSWLSATGAKRF